MELVCILVIGLANIKGFPKMPRALVREDLKTMQSYGLDVLLTQEMWTYQTPLRRALARWKGMTRFWRHNTRRGMSPAASVRAGKLRWVSKFVKPLHPGVKGEVDDRQIVGIRANDRATNIPVTALSVHFLPDRVGRRDLWDLGNERLVNVIEAELRAGRVVAGGGDFNEESKVLGTSIAGRRVVYSGGDARTIDHMFAIAPAGYEVEWFEKPGDPDEIHLNSDHDGRLGRLRITRQPAA